MEFEQIQNRRKSILSLLQLHSVLTVEEICDQLKITDSTARRDIKWLESQNMIYRFHGGVSALNNQYDVFDVRSKKASDAKKKIARAAAQLVVNSDVIFIGGGSTMFQFSKALLARQDLKNVIVVTSTFNVAALFAENRKYEIIILGGNLNKTDESIASKMTIENSKTINYTKIFNGAMGVSADCGITQPTADLAELERTLMARAGCNYLLVDHSKFGRVGAYTVYQISEVDLIITDKDASVDMEIEKHAEYKDRILQVE
ncbi:MAG: DeoR/GlpR family DNA-binding transcription regulator [Eubacteriales bacterium]|nr:DeoR/GlpR family DNA-binding transcription regulator [Eubacteriales bacterium]